MPDCSFKLLQMVDTTTIQFDVTSKSTHHLPAALAYWQLNFDQYVVFCLRSRQLDQDFPPHANDVPALLLHPGTERAMSPVEVADPSFVGKGCHRLDGG